MQTLRLEVEFLQYFPRFDLPKPHFQITLVAFWTIQPESARIFLTNDALSLEFLGSKCQFVALKMETVLAGSLDLWPVLLTNTTFVIPISHFSPNWHLHLLHNLLLLPLETPQLERYEAESCNYQYQSTYRKNYIKLQIPIARYPFTASSLLFRDMLFVSHSLAEKLLLLQHVR